ncbi:MAG: electron transport complex subunit RsxG [Gammaproteobacteria bacterium]|nr:MAG: electron transport complex subunit RsxG [Gammaproteobacteria bacterium]
MISKLRRNALLLGLAALVGAGLLASINHWARPRVEINRAEALRGQLAELVPAELYDTPLEQGASSLQASGLGVGKQSLYRARLNGAVTAVLITAVVADGYNGAIRLLVAVQKNGQVLGVRVLEHRETPGLGDAIERRKSDWILGFDGRSLDDPPLAKWMVRKDGGGFDQITAATITPRAVVGGVMRALEYVRDHHAELFETENTP